MPDDYSPMGPRGNSLSGGPLFMAQQEEERILGRPLTPEELQRRRAAGAPADERGALYRYNPSAAYVDAVERYAGRIRRDPAAFLVFYARRLIVRTPAGYRQLD